LLQLLQAYYRSVAVVLTVVAVVSVAYHYFAKAKYNPDPYARPGQKKAHRENKEAKKRNPEWNGNPNKRQKPPVKHTPMDGS